MDIRTPHIRTPYIGTPSIKAQSVGAGMVTGASKDVIATPAITLTGNSVTITCDTTGATIYYTLDGSTPTSSSSQYSSAFTLDSSCTIKAIAIKGGKSSAVAEESYVKPITYLTQWVIVGNSEVHNNEIWSCGEYNATDGKYHILVQPQGGNIADIALTEPLRKVNNVADTIEFVNGVTTVIRKIGCSLLSSLTWNYISAYSRIHTNSLSNITKAPADNKTIGNILAEDFMVYTFSNLDGDTTISYGIALAGSNNNIYVKDNNFIPESGKILPQAFYDYIEGKHLIYELETPTTELIDAPQIAEADSYTCVISQGAKAVSWSSFETE